MARAATRGWLGEVYRGWGSVVEEDDWLQLGASLISQACIIYWAGDWNLTAGVSSTRNTREAEGEAEMKPERKQRGDDQHPVGHAVPLEAVGPTSPGLTATQAARRDQCCTSTEPMVTWVLRMYNGGQVLPLDSRELALLGDLTHSAIFNHHCKSLQHSCVTLLCWLLKAWHQR
ncbi:hypothetical protein GW7_15335 [Heterocephalus glaber]|uniref:Uncharacterized protein n=1 Tax=Heterocephalus glaber TaxID=10181 RepID=G5B8T8_HETGA|nr:hypothetical protein GW7_15335 [Heterocephalus glaber]